MSLIQFLRRSKAAKVAAIGIVAATSLSTLTADIYIRYYYAAVMPRSPQPDTGRIQPLNAQNGGLIYVSQQELDRRDFVRNDMGTASAVLGLLLFFVGTRAGWFRLNKRL